MQNRRHDAGGDPRSKRQAARVTERDVHERRHANKTIVMYARLDRRLVRTLL
jgi:hypothetical protein